MIIEVKKEDVYITTWNGNDKLPTGEQIQIDHRFLTPDEKQKYVYTKNVKVNKLKGTVDSDVEAVQDMKGIVYAIVTGIRNFSIKVDKKTIKIDTVEKLYTTNGVPSGLVADIEVGMLLASPEVDIERLKKP